MKAKDFKLVIEDMIERFGEDVELRLWGEEPAFHAEYAFNEKTKQVEFAGINISPGSAK